MTEPRLSDLPLDFEGPARDELVDGNETVKLVLADSSTVTEPVSPTPCSRCDAVHRELLVQSEMLVSQQDGIDQAVPPRKPR